MALSNERETLKTNFLDVNIMVEPKSGKFWSHQI